MGVDKTKRACSPKPRPLAGRRTVYTWMMIRWLIGIILATLLAAALVGAWQWQSQGVGEIIAPEPLRGPLHDSGGALTAAGILAETNRQRETSGRPPLHPNATLDQAAQKKVADMLAHQYFAHQAPDGTGPGDLVAGVNYRYIRVGENLALGNFASDAALVQAWMDSPGHRDNILHPGFTEIGLAAARGTFEGTTVWLAVQTFAAPLSSCPRVDPALQKQFDQLKDNLDQLTAQLTNQSHELADMTAQLDNLAQEVNQLAQDEEPAQLERAQAKQAEYDSLYASYDAKRSAYNNQVSSQRQQIDALQAAQDHLNQQIRTFNECIK